MVEVFKTNINSRRLANKIQNCLEEAFPGHSINFDLDDCDRILRIESESLNCEQIINIVMKYGISITILED